jgi:surface protein
MISMFEQNTRPFTVPAATAPDLSICTNMGSMFKGATTFNQPIGHWNVSNVSLMQGVFDQATAFNQSLSGWDVSKVTTFNITFRGASSFNQNLSSWNIGACLNTNGMFTSAAAFNNGGDPGINNWNTSKVTNMGSMFNNASTFNQPIGNWDTRKVTTMASMFNRAYAFNQPIGTWNIPLVTDTSQMFAGGGVGIMTFNQPLVSTATTWQVGQITNIVVMFQNCISFDQDLSSWVCTQITAANESTTATAFSTGANAAWRAARATKFPFLNDGVTRIST